MPPMRRTPAWEASTATHKMSSLLATPPSLAHLGSTPTQARLIRGPRQQLAQTALPATTAELAKMARLAAVTVVLLSRR
jgi:hypothetical protein